MYFHYFIFVQEDKNIRNCVQMSSLSNPAYVCLLSIIQIHCSINSRQFRKCYDWYNTIKTIFILAFDPCKWTQKHFCLTAAFVISLKYTYKIGNNIENINNHKWFDYLQEQTCGSFPAFSWFDSQNLMFIILLVIIVMSPDNTKR